MLGWRPYKTLKMITVHVQYELISCERSHDTDTDTTRPDRGPREMCQI